jgi:hypothetical protein
MTTDYLLKFPDRTTAVMFGLQNGFATIDEDGNEQITLASHEYALHVIGEHNGDGQWWVLFRDLVGIPIPEGGEQFIYWASTSGEQRPSDESTPNIFWS